MLKMENKEFNKSVQEAALNLESALKAAVPQRTGRLKASIKAGVVESKDGATITIEGEEYILFLPAERAKRMAAKPSSFTKKKGGLLQKFEDGPMQKQLNSPKLTDAYANDAEKAVLKMIDNLFKS